VQLPNNVVAQTYVRGLNERPPSRWLLYKCSKLVVCVRCVRCGNTETKNQWARDDPAFIAILVLFMAVAAIAYSVAFNAWNPVTLLRIMFWAAFIEFLGLGLATATLGWFATHNTTQHTHGTHDG
jgi:uncharacterized protein (DUF983 family)